VMLFDLESLESGGCAGKEGKSAQGGQGAVASWIGTRLLRDGSRSGRELMRRRSALSPATASDSQARFYVCTSMKLRGDGQRYYSKW